MNLRALRCLKPDGLLVTCSCSHWFGRERFMATLEEAASDAGRTMLSLVTAPDLPAGCKVK